jgi:CHAT domain-containing protein
LAYQALSATLLADSFLERAAREKLSAEERNELIELASQWHARAADAHRQVRDLDGLTLDKLREASLAAWRGNWQEALRLAGQATHAAELRELFEPHWRALALSGEAQAALGRTDEAIQSLEQAAALIESQRALLQSEPARQSFFGSKIEVYERLALLYLQTRPNEGERIWQLMERAKARTLLDLVGGQPLAVKGAQVVALRERRPELFASLPGKSGAPLKGFGAQSMPLDQDALMHTPDELREAASLASVQPVSLSAVQALLTPGETLLEYFTAGDSLLAAVVTSGAVKIVKLDGWGRERLHAEVEAVRRLLEDPASDYESPLRRLHDDLVAPCLRDGLPRRLIVVPAAALHYLPFAALVSRDGKFLLEQCELSYAASASALVWARQARQRQQEGILFASQGQRALVVANPRPHVGFAPLPAAAIEGRDIAKLNAECALLIDGDATESAMMLALPYARWFHFAGHTDLPASSPVRAALLCTEEVEEDGRLEVRDIFSLALPNCELAVLSACDTRLGRWSRGDEVMGLERAFLRAGVPTVVASLWKVDDSSTQLLMRSFYESLWQHRRGKLASLRAAQLAVMNGQLRDRIELARRGLGAPEPLIARPTYSGPTRHPFFWAAFVLSGDWR